jgi:hypothetical protein
MYVQVRRHKTTVFLQVEPSETVLELKAKVEQVLCTRSRDMQLLLPSPQSPLDDSASLESQGIQDDHVVPLCLWDTSSECFDEPSIVDPCQPSSLSDTSHASEHEQQQQQQASAAIAPS